MTLTRAEIQAAFAVAKKNHHEWTNCRKHQILRPAAYKIGVRCRCVVCGASVDLVTATAYALGYQAAGGDPSDVLRADTTGVLDVYNRQAADEAARIIAQEAFSRAGGVLNPPSDPSLREGVPPGEVPE